MFPVLTRHASDRGLLYQGSGLWARRVYFQQLHCFSSIVENCSVNGAGHNAAAFDRIGHNGLCYRVGPE